MPDTPSITIVKTMTYRGKREEFSNKYHFTGTTPANAAAWKTLADWVISQEREIMHSGIKFVRAYGYEAGNELSVAQIDYEAAPLTPVAGKQPAPNGLANPESAITVRWRTGDRNSRKKWIYLRKYYHGVPNSGSGDNVDANTLTNANAIAAALIAGSGPGGFKYCGPQGAAALTSEANPYYTTRELKRRGKRPSR